MSADRPKAVERSPFQAIFRRAFPIPVFELRMESASSPLTSWLCAEAARVLILVQIAITKVELENRDEGLERGRRSPRFSVDGVIWRLWSGSRGFEVVFEV